MTLRPRMAVLVVTTLLALLISGPRKETNRERRLSMTNLYVIENEREFYEKYTNHLREQTNLEVFIDNVPDEDETKIKEAVRELLVAEVVKLAHEKFRTSGVSDELLKDSRKDLRTTLRELPLPEKDQRIVEAKVRRLAREPSPSPEAVGREIGAEPPSPTQLLEHRYLEPDVQASHSWSGQPFEVMPHSENRAERDTTYEGEHDPINEHPEYPPPDYPEDDPYHPRRGEHDTSRTRGEPEHPGASLTLSDPAGTHSAPATSWTLATNSPTLSGPTMAIIDSLCRRMETWSSTLGEEPFGTLAPGGCRRIAPNLRRQSTAGTVTSTSSTRGKHTGLGRLERASSAPRGGAASLAGRPKPRNLRPR
jgi:hypothetical protein